ncbi:unnamed protein product [[Candida] boidinii]|nr:unnamed protein product [[Candida] boidinii]
MDPNQKQFQPNQFPQHQEQQSQQPPQQSVTTPMASIFTPPQVIFTPPNMNSNATPSNITPPNYGGLQQNFTNKVTNNVAATQNYTPSPQLQQLQEMGYPDYLYSVQDPSVNPNANSSSNSNSN